jgi:hypothetical protein
MKHELQKVEFTLIHRNDIESLARKHYELKSGNFDNYCLGGDYSYIPYHLKHNKFYNDEYDEIVNHNDESCIQFPVIITALIHDGFLPAENYLVDCTC